MLQEYLIQENNAPMPDSNHSAMLFASSQEIIVCYLFMANSWPIVS